MVEGWGLLRLDSRLGFGCFLLLFPLGSCYNILLGLLSGRPQFAARDLVEHILDLALEPLIDLHLHRLLDPIDGLLEIADQFRKPLKHRGIPLHSLLIEPPLLTVILATIQLLRGLIKHPELLLRDLPILSFFEPLVHLHQAVLAQIRVAQLGAHLLVEFVDVAYQFYF